MGIFKEMYDERHFESARDYVELRRMLSEAVERGCVEQVPRKWITWSQEEVWYRDRETGEVYALTGPPERSFGHWNRVDFQDFLRPPESVQ
jgi:hypothetical protein